MTNVDGGIALGEGTHGMHMVVENDRTHHDSLTEKNRLWVLEALGNAGRLDHRSADVGHGAQAVGRVFERYLFVLPKMKRTGVR
jgi:hypothetical protein